MKRYRSNGVTYLFLLLLCLILSGCTMRPEVSPEPEPTPVAVTIEEFTASFYYGDELLASVPFDEQNAPAVPSLPQPGLTVVGWQFSDGSPADPTSLQSESVSLYAVVRPVLSSAPFLSADEHGCIRPADQLTKEELGEALSLLLDGVDYPLDFTISFGEEAAPVTLEECTGILKELAAPDSVPELAGDVVTRASFAEAIVSFREAGTDTGAYFPDNSPLSGSYDALCLAGIPTEHTAGEYAAEALDGYLWLDGYLYCWDEENGCFLCNSEHDGLLFDGNGLYTCGSTELDDYVAETLSERMDPTLTREDNLRIMYRHIKNDFQYLPRNYYDSGATDWDIEEALTLFRTGKGNCYCYTGAFCALARGLGYNAVTWSGTMGTQNQQHAWTEITIDGSIYICDPEIEMNYWLLEMYTDNFMMPKSESYGWNYQAAGREN